MVKNEECVAYIEFGPGLIERGCSPDRRDMSPREVLANLACKVHHLVVLV